MYYSSLENFNKYIDSHSFNNTPCSSLTEDDKGSLLNYAESIIDSLTYIGMKSDLMQDHAFPRSFFRVHVNDYVISAYLEMFHDQIPPFVEKAVYEQALYLMQTENLKEVKKMIGLFDATQIRMADTELYTNPKNYAKNDLAPKARTILSYFLLVETSLKGMA